MPTLTPTKLSELTPTEKITYVVQSSHDSTDVTSSSDGKDTGNDSSDSDDGSLDSESDVYKPTPKPTKSH